MRWWDYAALLATIFISAGLGGLMGAWAAERRLDQHWDDGTSLPPVVNPQKAEDAGEATNG